MPDGTSPPRADRRRAAEAAPGRTAARRDPMLEAKLWKNPCWFSFRLNYLALRYNLPLYTWVRERHGLSRPEYVVVYSLALAGEGRAQDIVRTSGFPKNTLSRAVSRLLALGLVERSGAGGAGRSQALRLAPAGRALFAETLPAFVAHERQMLAALTEAEQTTLSRLMAKIVLGGGPAFVPPAASPAPAPESP